MPTDTFTPIVELHKVDRFNHIAGLWGGGTLELYNEAGKCFKFHLKDPEGLPLFMDILDH